MLQQRERLIEAAGPGEALRTQDDLARLPLRGLARTLLEGEHGRLSQPRRAHVARFEFQPLADTISVTTM